MTARSLAPRSKLPVERVRQLLRYDPETGKFVWKVDRMCGRYYKQFAARAGDDAANITSGGRIQIHVDGGNYKAHRLAWFYVHGVWPSEIDHRDGNPANNAIANLRIADRFMNMQNLRKAKTGNSSGMLGVTRRRNGKCIAQICVNRVTRYLGSFDTPEEAHAVYLKAKRKHHKGCTL